MSLRALLALLLGLTPGASAASFAARGSAPRLPAVPVAPAARPAALGALGPALSLSPAPSLAPSLSPAALARPVPAHAAALAAASAAPSRASDRRAAPEDEAAPAARDGARLAAPAEGLPAPARLRFDELRAAFGERVAESLPAAADAPRPREGGSRLDASRPEARGPSSRPPAPRPRPGLLGLPKALGWFLLALIVSQAGLEAQLAGLPPLLAKVFGDVSVAANAGMVNSLGDIAGTLLTPLIVKRLGLKRTYAGAVLLRVATGALLAGLLATGSLGLVGLMALIFADNVLEGVSWTAEKSIPAVALDQDQAKLERFKALRQVVIESAATVVPIATGAVVAYWGFVPAMAAFPLAAAVSAAIVLMTLRLPARPAGAGAAAPPGPSRETNGRVLAKLARGAWAVLRDPVLLLSMLAYSFVYAPLSVIYWVAAPAFALFLAGPGAEQASAAYLGMITGLYSLGGIVAGLLLVHAQRRERSEAQMRLSMLRWTAAAALASTAFLSLAWTTPLWGTLTLPALALLLFAVPQVVAKLKLESFFQSRAPQGSVEDATAVLELASSLAITLALWWSGRLLDGAAVASLGWLAAAVAPLVAVLLLLTWALARASAGRKGDRRSSRHACQEERLSPFLPWRAPRGRKSRNDRMTP